MQQSSLTSNKPPSRGLWWLLAGISVAVVLFVTLLPQASQRGVNWVPLSQSSPAFKALLRSSDPLAHPAFRFLFWQVVGNVAVFVPVGLSIAGLVVERGRWKAFFLAVGAGLALSLLIETIQLALPTRATDVDDLIFNTAGAALGALLLLFFTGQGKKPKR